MLGPTSPPKSSGTPPTKLLCSHAEGVDRPRKRGVNHDWRMRVNVSDLARARALYQYCHFQRFCFGMPCGAAETTDIERSNVGVCHSAVNMRYSPILPKRKGLVQGTGLNAIAMG